MQIPFPCPFRLLMFSFDEKKFLNCIKFEFHLFSFVVSAFIILFKNLCLIKIILLFKKKTFNTVKIHFLFKGFCIPPNFLFIISFYISHCLIEKTPSFLPFWALMGACLCLPLHKHNNPFIYLDFPKFQKCFVIFHGAVSLPRFLIKVLFWVFLCLSKYQSFSFSSYFYASIAIQLFLFLFCFVLSYWLVFYMLATFSSQS